MAGRSGLLLSSWATRHPDRNVQSTAEETVNPRSSKWEPVKPFIADPGRYSGQQPQALSLGQPQRQQQQVYPWRSTDSAAGGYRSNEYPSEVKGLKGVGEKADSAGYSTRGKPAAKDKVRKSLSFEEKETGNDAADVSQVSWRDVLNESASSGRAWGTTSEEEESSSPLLARSHASLDNSGAGGNKSSDISAGDKSSVLTTGSSSLNGSALVARAEERRVGFERRQAELKQQLMDIQQQKDSILHRYQAGQAALHQQQAALREKLLVAAAGGTLGATGEASGTTTSGAIRKNQPASAAAVGIGEGRDTHTQSTGNTWASSLALGGSRLNPSESRSSTQSKSGDHTDKSRETISPANTDAALSGRPSLASTGTPGNISADSFLTDISYYKLKNGDQASLPPSAFQLQAESSTNRPPFTMPRRDTSASAPKMDQRQTWAALLQTSSSLPLLTSSADTDKDARRKPVPSSAISKTKVSSSDAASILQRSTKTPSPPSEESNSDSQPAPSSVAPPMLGLPSTAMTLAQHQPHELSTILEVDTPTSSSTTNRHGRQQHQHQHRQGALVEQGAAMSASASNSSQSLSSQCSSTVQGARGGGVGGGISGGVKAGSDGGVGGEAPVIDTFPELPYTFTRPGTVFDLTSEGQRSEGVTPATLPDRSGDFGGSARRSINFSKESKTAASLSQNYRVQPVVERKEHDDEDEDDDTDDTNDDNDDDLLSTPMPFLVQSTPGKSVTPRTDEVSSDNSSLQISGYSEYLRGATAGTAATLAPSTGDKDIDQYEVGRPISEEIALADRLDFNSGESQLQSQEATRNADQFGPDLMQRLRQQSRDVFGDSADGLSQSVMEEGGASLEHSDIVGEGGLGGDTSLGNRSSQPSTDLYEVSILDTTDGDN
ncbi:hypothetical protein EGW08_018538 [Elysia chlorotica]|uniref:Uncharacterized protein n=1 Tax=Elysia chlorotica TaxID=188477 RepID=A0A433SWM9_ELYCH|nr:hypothetical protein EGW08_018538 [Elysia chlorotica]